LVPLVVAVLWSFASLGETSNSNFGHDLNDEVGEWIANKAEALAKFGPISEWDTSKVTTMSFLFEEATAFDDDLSAWDVSRVRNMALMFYEASSFTSELSSWDVSRVRQLSSMFSGASTFASNLSSWNVSAAQNTNAMFSGASEFTSNLNAWDVASVTSAGWMFSGASEFTSNLNAWDVSRVTSTRSMFYKASKFTSSLSSWDVSADEDLSNMFYQASEFMSDLSSWQVAVPPSKQANMFDGTRLARADLPCWHVGTTCSLPIVYLGDLGSRKPLDAARGVTTVDPTAMSATYPYRVGTTYRIAPLDVMVESAHTYSLIDAPNGFYINPKTGVVLATFGVTDITLDRSGGTDHPDPLEVTLQVIADSGDRRTSIETYIMHIEDRKEFSLVFLQDPPVYNRHTYLGTNEDDATLVLVGAPFRVAARLVDQEKTTLSGGGFGDITFTFKVDNATTGDPISEELDRISIKPNGELLGEFSEREVGNYTIHITAFDGAGEPFRLEPFTLDVRQLDIHTPAYGPNNKGCANNGVPFDDSSGGLFDGKFTCNCGGVALFVGENCDEQCRDGQRKDFRTGKCANEEPKNTTGSTLAIVTGAILVLLLVALAATRYRQHLLSMRPIDFDQFNRTMLENGTFLNGQLSTQIFPRELKRSNVVLLEQVGRGAFGAVWKAMLDESTTTGNPEYQVAAKTVLDANSAPEATADLMTEAAVMAQLAGHPNLVSIIGVVTSGNPLILILSYCDHGSMLSHLKRSVAEGNALPLAHKIDFAAQTARGMAHLSGRHFIHRDLAARNVLLTSGRSTSNLVCKVADFGLSRGGHGDEVSIETEDYYKSHNGVFPVRWTAPEAMESLIFNQASDVWAFGVLLVELVQDGDRPYHGLKCNSDVMALTMSGRRHKQPEGCSNDLYGIMMQCWHVESKQRPSFKELASALDQRYSCVVREPPEGASGNGGDDYTGIGAGGAVRSVVGASGDEYEYAGQQPAPARPVSLGEDREIDDGVELRPLASDFNRSVDTSEYIRIVSV
jgi:surface protein